MSYWMMIVVASGAVLALGLLFTLLVIALDKEELDEPVAVSDGRRWTSGL